MVILYSEDVFPNGKYKDQKIEDISVIDPAYLKWWQNNSNNVCISDEVLDNLSDNDGS